ncbi:hypothetical protein CLOP_g15131 [Closterium sp. NIES-67]|nr:hypothetical protein CLOP_g15131 [Closterium sp. NIES-67]
MPSRMYPNHPLRCVSQSCPLACIPIMPSRLYLDMAKMRCDGISHRCDMLKTKPKSHIAFSEAILKNIA